ncbi:hypothetical protein IGI04_012062 [Brassica rapa subsp. trilocularis]|uniref:Uncharacterized protein n=1 Tax=Brassica rapa subsp. trilocularis TaxID=1813537 RepID=A0ABQ7N5N1_BRACM|nr:hypothetical protein IGI04_012062 [Brassica rapa subsp. trilocularis]
MEAMKKKFLNMRSFREITWKSSIDLPMLKSFFSFFDMLDSFCLYTILRATWIMLIRTVVLLAASFEFIFSKSNQAMLPYELERALMACKFFAVFLLLRGTSDLKIRDIIPPDPSFPGLIPHLENCKAVSTVPQPRLFYCLENQ